MARDLIGVPTVDPAKAPAVYQSGAAATPEAFGAPQARAVAEQGAAQRQVGQGLQQLGAGAFRAADFFGVVAADEASNSYEESVTKIMYGDPNKQVPGPDGTMIPDTGYMGLKGRAALEARPVVAKQIDDLLAKTRDGLKTPLQVERFDNFSRRYRAITNAQIGAYAANQEKQWAGAVNSASGKLALERIAGNPDDPTILANSISDLTNARVKNAELLGAKPGDPLWLEAVASAKRDALSARLQSIAVHDPARAMNLLEQHKELAGPQYATLAQHFRARAAGQVGRQYADGLLGAATPLPDPTDAAGVLKHFEGFRNDAYWDVNHWRVGYGSDTITRPDGKVEEVTAHTVVTREDAERDLARRVQISAGQVKDAIGAEAWDKLDDRAKASLTSIAYNYGRMPNELVEAARSGDKQKLAAAIMGLSSHNHGVNAKRRATEAQNVLGGEGAAPRSEEDILAQIQNSNLDPEAKAAATAQVARTRMAQNAARTKEKAEFKTRVLNSATEALQTGETANPIPKEDFVKQFGPIDGPTHYEDYNADLQYGAARHAFETMSDTQIQNFIDQGQPKPGDPSYARKVKNNDRLQKYAEALSKQRRDDPAGAVSRQPAVKSAMAGYDPKQPETFMPVVEARLIEQGRLGIEALYWTPITKAEALQMTKPAQLALPGERIDALEALGKQFRDMFGPYATQAFVYAMKAMHAQGLAIQDAEAVFDNLTRGRPITKQERLDQQAREQSRQISEATAAKEATSDQMWMQVWPDSGLPMTPPGSPQKGRAAVPMTPTSSDVLDLQKGRVSDADFDKLFGAGMAKTIRDKFPTFFKGQGHGG